MRSSRETSAAPQLMTLVRQAKTLAAAAATAPSRSNAGSTPSSPLRGQASAFQPAPVSAHGDGFGVGGQLLRELKAERETVLWLRGRLAKAQETQREHAAIEAEFDSALTLLTDAKLKAESERMH